MLLLLVTGHVKPTSAESPECTEQTQYHVAEERVKVPPSAQRTLRQNWASGETYFLFVGRVAAFCRRT